VGLEGFAKWCGRIVKITLIRSRRPLPAYLCYLNAGRSSLWALAFPFTRAPYCLESKSQSRYQRHWGTSVCECRMASVNFEGALRRQEARRICLLNALDDMEFDDIPFLSSLLSKLRGTTRLLACRSSKARSCPSGNDADAPQGAWAPARGHPPPHRDSRPHSKRSSLHKELQSPSRCWHSRYRHLQHWGSDKTQHSH
jgi:hypothetical protein